MLKEREPKTHTHTHTHELDTLKDHVFILLSYTSDK
jgi:hypothetical protein